MHLRLRTYVEQPPEVVWAGFNRDLFLRLNPPFPPVRLLHFDGCQTGDVVSMNLNFLLFSQVWTSRITEQRTTPGEIYFIDQGVELPFFLRTWRHRHRLIRQDPPAAGTLIADEICFQTPNRLLDHLLYPVLLALFAYRKPIYEQMFIHKKKLIQ